MNVLKSCSIVLFCVSCLPAQDLLVQNVAFRQENETVFITYDLQGKANKKYPISLILSSASNPSFSHVPQAVSGDIDKVRPGTDKEIVWQFTKDFPDGLQGEDFVFTLTAEYKKSLWPYYLLGGGAALLGGVAYLASQTGDDAEETTGSIVINIP
ncbi:hypothetical protein EH223_20370 [candidate division KSB1 bacterium]|nr:hypothetical protein [candidate division KSB1 bacterium]RQV99858.1 MAG: hypothetical protein EH223_20370 [candidate division KSB1 bacterium]